MRLQLVLILLTFSSLASAQEPEKVGVHYDRLKVFEPLIGKATGHSKFGTLKGKATREFKWDAAKNTIIVTETYTATKK